MAITNDEQLFQAVEQVQRLYKTMVALRRDSGGNSRNFGLLAEGPLAQLEALQGEIDAYSGVGELRGQEADLWLRVAGATVDWRRASTSVITEMLDVLRKGVQAVAEVLSTGKLGTRPTAELKRVCDLQMVAVAPGSLKIGLRLPDDAQLSLVDFESPEALASSALDQYLAVAEWAGSDADQAGLEQFKMGAELQRTVLIQLMRLVPRKRGDVEFVELSGRRMPTPKPIQFKRHTRARLHAAIDRTVEERPEVIQGILREIDLDKRSFILRHIDQPTEYRCEFDADLVETAKTALDQLVEVAGTRSVGGSRRSMAPLKVSRLEVLDDDESAGQDGSD